MGGIGFEVIILPSKFNIKFNKFDCRTNIANKSGVQQLFCEFEDENANRI